MTRRLISSGSKFESDIGYSRAVVDGEWVFVSGTTGFNYATMAIEEDVVAQCEQALKNIEAALRQAGAGFEDVVRASYLLTSAADFEKCWPALGRAFGTVRPAVVAMVVGLVDPRMKIEIEVTARRRVRLATRATPARKKAPRTTPKKARKEIQQRAKPKRRGR